MSEEIKLIEYLKIHSHEDNYTKHLLNRKRQLEKGLEKEEPEENLQGLCSYDIRMNE